jgi:RNA polymerase sigma-70 factor (ECF subfamily)
VALFIAPARSEEPAVPAHFPQTSWSLVARAGAPLTPEGFAALSTLSRRYWYPVYAFLRRRGASAADAEDLTQGFFARLLETNGLAAADPARGRFRSWLLACVKNHVANARDRDRAEKRGGGMTLESFDAAEAQRRYGAEPAHHLTPERLYERRFALALLEGVLAELRAQYARGGKERLFVALQGRLTGGADERSYEEVAAELGTSAGTVRTAASRLSERYRALLRAEVEHLVAEESDVDDELGHLLSALGDDPSP